MVFLDLQFRTCYFTPCLHCWIVQTFPVIITRFVKLTYQISCRTHSIQNTQTTFELNIEQERNLQYSMNIVLKFEPGRYSQHPTGFRAELGARYRAIAIFAICYEYRAKLRPNSIFKRHQQIWSCTQS